MRYNSNGGLDTSFGGGDGKVITNIGTGHDQANSVTVQADGKILLGGYSTNGSYTEFALVRYNSDGTLDSTFGGGDGIVTTNIGIPSGQANSVIVQSDGKILLGGYSSNVSALYQNFTLVRYNRDGTLDTSFGGGDGIATAAPGISNNEGRSITLQANGKILVGGSSWDGTKYSFSMARFNSEGTLDTTFGGGDGMVITSLTNGTAHDIANSLTVQTDGKILLAGTINSGSLNSDFGLVRYNSNGTLDLTFGGGYGMVATNVAYPYDAGKSVKVQADDKILLGGYSWNGSNYDFAVTRYDSNGVLDASFGGGDGIVITDLGSNDNAENITLQADGKILLVGYSTLPGYDFALVRYNSDGTLDTSFDSVNALGGSTSFTEGGAAVALDSSVDISDSNLDALNGGLGDYSGANLTLVRNTGAAAEDVFSFTDANGITLVGGNLIKNAQIIASFDTTTPGQLLINFTHTNGETPTSADVDNILHQITYANSSDTPPASAQIDWTFNDGNSGAQGSGGPLDVTGSTTVTITADNDAPVNSVSGAQVTNEDTVLIFNTTNSNLISISDEVGEILTTTVSVTNGTLTLSQVTGLTFDAGSNASSTMTVTGTVENINAALDGLQYTPTLDYNGGDTLTIKTSDTTLLTLNLDANLLGYYEFYNATGGDDSSPLATNNGTLKGNASVVNDATRGDVLSLDGVGDYVDITGRVTTSQQATLSAWVNVDAGASNAEVISVTNSFTLRVSTSGVQAFFYGSGGFNATSSAVDIRGTGWHHIAYTMDNTNDEQVLYIDGVAVTTTTYTAAVDYMTVGTGDTYIGSNEGASNYFEGSIDNARIYDRALTATEIADLQSAPVEVTDTSTVAITVFPVNDAPTVTNLNVAGFYTEDTPLNLIDIVVTDADNANTTVTLTLSDISAGSLSIATSGLVTSTFVGGVWAASGTVADVNALLAGVTFNPTLNYDQNFSIAISVDDGIVPAVTGTHVMTAISVNDAPTTTPVILTAIAEDSGARLITQAELLSNAADVDGPSLTATNLAINTGLGTLVDNFDGTWTYTPVLNDDTAVTFTYTVTDSLLTAAGAASLDITPVNDAPHLVGDSIVLNGTFDTDLSDWTIRDNVDGSSGEVRFGQVGGGNGTAFS